MKSFLSMLEKFVINKFFVTIFCFLTLLTAIISFILKINLSSILGPQDLSPYLLNFDIKTRAGGVVNDLKIHWEYILLLKDDFFNLFYLQMGIDTNLINFPLHNIIFSQFYYFNNSIENYLIIVFIISLILPILFFLCLKEKFQEINKYKLLILSSVIYLLPAFQYTAIWGNNHITALIFLVSGIFFHLKFKKSNFKNFKYYFLTVFFVSLACYTKQYYVFFFLYLIVEFFFKLKFKNFILNCIVLTIFSLPGIIFLYKNPLLFFGLRQEVTNFYSSILISASIIFFYLIPILVQYFFNLPGKIKLRFQKFFNIKIFIISLIVTLICILPFEYNGIVGGGIFYKIFIVLLKNKSFFFFSSFLGIYFILFFCKKNFQNIFLAILILSSFSTGFFIFQKYFEPMFLILFLIYFDKTKITRCIEKNNIFFLSYLLGYYLILNYIYFLGV